MRFSNVIRFRARKTYKKMYPVKKRKGASLKEILNYTLPKLHMGKTWYVDFMCYDPGEQKMKRKKYMLDGIAKVSDRRKRAADIIVNVTAKLREGWNPWVEMSNSRQFTKVDAVINMYVRYIEKLYKSQSIKENTYRDYMKRLRVLQEYMDNHAVPIMYIYQFNLSYISDFLDYILLDRDSSARTRNNYKTWVSSFCTWLVEKQYLEVNPCEHIKALREEPKRREAISAKDLHRLGNYLKEHNPYFLLVCRVLYYTFIRPEELTNIRLKDIYIKEQKVFVGGDISKNRRDGMVGLNDELVKSMIELGIFRYDGDYYLFSTGFKPGQKKITTKVLRNYFYKVRDALRISKNYQFYSLKDSGIRDLANAAGIVVARDQARHSDISTTNKYLKGSALTVHEETKHFKGEL